MMAQEGQKVSYIGPACDGHTLVMGDQGTVVQADQRSAHVLVSTGSAAGAIVLLDQYDIAPLGKQASVSDDGLDDSLDVGTIAATGVLGAYDEEGEVGVLNALAAEGRLDGFEEIAQDALGLIQARLRQDPAIRACAAQLGDEAGERLISLASSVLLRDAFGVED